MQLLKNFKRLKASSIVESVIAIAIISVCSLVAFMVYINVIKQNKAITYYTAKHHIERITQKAIEENDFSSDNYKYTGFTINKEVTISEEEHVAYILFTINTGGKTYVINKLIPYYES